MTHEETKTFKILRNWEKIRKDLHKPFTEAPLLEAEIHFSIQQAIAEDRARVVEEIKEGVGYGKFGFSRIDKGHEGEVAINIDDLISSIPLPDKE